MYTELQEADYKKQCDECQEGIASMNEFSFFICTFLFFFGFLLCINVNIGYEGYKMEERNKFILGMTTVISMCITICFIFWLVYSYNVKSIAYVDSQTVIEVQERVKKLEKD